MGRENRNHYEMPQGIIFKLFKHVLGKENFVLTRFLTWQVTFKDKEQCGAYEKDDIRGRGMKAKEF